jgi:small redox-active disulfide protein 2
MNLHRSTSSDGSGVLKNKIIMNIQILGTGCPKCKTLEKAVREIVAESKLDATVTKVDDIMEILKFNVMTTPALVIDGKVVLKGRVPSMVELKEILTNKIFFI